MSEKKGFVISTRFTSEDFHYIAGLAQRDGLTLSEFIREAAMHEAERRRIAVTWHSNWPLRSLNVA